jgi:tetratricopeptide (TPR) repeat protein
MPRGPRRSLAAALLAGCLMLAPGAAPLGWAAPPSSSLPGPRPETALVRVAELTRQARDLHYEATRHRSRESPERVTLMQRAISTLIRAVQLDEKNVENRVLLAEWLARPELGEASLLRAGDELLRARKDDDVDALAYDIASLLGLVYSHLGRFAEAVTEYDRALRVLAAEPDQVAQRRNQQNATLLGNSAEALMAVGRLDEAIRRYALAEQTDKTDFATLHALGLAVAYDRDGQTHKSREALTRSLAADPGLHLFQSDDVFFAPEGDRFYYEGLIAEGLDNRDDALRAFQEFLRAQPQSRYADRARFHIEELKKLPGISALELLRANVLQAPPQLAVEDTALRHHRSEDDILKVARSHQLELRRCYVKGLRQRPRLGGDLAIALLVNRDGAVILVQPLENTLDEHAEPPTTAPLPSGRERDKDRGRDKAPAVPPPGQTAAELLRCVTSSIHRWRFSPAEPDIVDQDELALPMRVEVRG